MKVEIIWLFYELLSSILGIFNFCFKIFIMIAMFGIIFSSSYNYSFIQKITIYLVGLSWLSINTNIINAYKLHIKANHYFKQTKYYKDNEEIEEMNNDNS